MLIGVVDRAGTRRCAFALAIPVVAAALRDDGHVDVYDPDLPRDRWRVTRTATGVEVGAPPPTLFDPDPTQPVWVARLIEATIQLL